MNMLHIPLPRNEGGDDVFAAHPMLIETRPPWSEVFLWQRRAAWSVLAALLGWTVVVVMMVAR